MDFTTFVTGHIFCIICRRKQQKEGRIYTKKSTNANDCKFGLSRDKCEGFFCKFPVLNISMILKELHCLFVKNKIIQANSCKLSLKRTRKFINSLHKIYQIKQPAVRFYGSTYKEFHLDI